MLTSIFHPKKPKTALDILTIVSLVLQIVLFFTLRGNVRRGFFVVYFAFWRGAYNGGLGYILKAQSEREWIVKTVKRQGWLDAKRRPKVYDWAKHHLVMKMDKDYDFDALPLEYNVWLLFRSIVDVILLNDVRLWCLLFPSHLSTAADGTHLQFVAYSLFAFSCTRSPEGHSFLMHLLRWIAGWGLIFFNLWVKMDAHRVVKDYAWSVLRDRSLNSGPRKLICRRRYWGDCFFLCLQSLVFDGVYECAPDPMYS